MATKKSAKQISKKAPLSKQNTRQEVKVSQISGKSGNSLGIVFMDQLLLWILIAVLCLIPLLIRGHVSQFVSPTIAPGLLSSGVHDDLFVYHKWIALIFLTAVALLLTIIKVTTLKANIRSSYINLPLLGLFSLVMAASLFSEYKGISLFGMYDMREGLITILCYLGLFIAAANITFKRKYFYYCIAALAVVILVNDCLGTAWFFGFDLLNNPAIQSIVIPEGVAASEGSSLKTTLLNPNYMSGLGGALCVLGFTLAILVKENRKRIMFGILTLLSFVMLLTSLSFSGILIVYVLVPVIIIFCLIKMSFERKKVLLTACALILSGYLLFMMFNSHNPKVGREFTSFFNNRKIVQNVVRDWPGKDFGLPKPGWGAGTGRVYIWNKTVELIEKKPFLGYGPGTLAYYFPQYDISVSANLKSYYDWVTKPHNMYLGIAYSAGIPALIILLFLFARHFFSSIGILIRKSYDEDYVFIAALFAFWLAFLMQWIFNDSFIGTSPIFWVLFGVSVSLGSGINYAETEKLNSKP